MSDLVVDTHAVVWYLQASSQLSVAARYAINTSIEKGFEILLPSISLVELIYLTEKGRLHENQLSGLFEFLERPDSSFRIQDLTSGIAESTHLVPRAIVPDMPDRVIAATSLFLSIPLVTRDNKIRKLRNIETIW